MQKGTTDTQALRHGEQGSSEASDSIEMQPIARKGFARYRSVAALGLIFGAVVTMLTPFAADLSSSHERATLPSVLRGAPGEALRLTLSYEVSAPAAR